MRDPHVERVTLRGGDEEGAAELAETVGDGVARQENIALTLFPMSLATRGSGKVGEMTKLLLDESRTIGGRCYWTVEARAAGSVWRRYYVTPDGRKVLSAGPQSLKKR